jgi:hypothetical protein
MASIDFWEVFLTAARAVPGQATSIYETQKQAVEAAAEDFAKFKAKLHSAERAKLKKAEEGAAELEKQLLECEEQIKHLDREREESDDLKAASTLVRKIVEARMRREELQAWLVKVKANNAAQARELDGLDTLAIQAKLAEMLADLDTRRREIESTVMGILGEQAFALAGVLAVKDLLTNKKMPEPPPAPEPAPEPVAEAKPTKKNYADWDLRTPRGVAVPGMKSEGSLRTLGSYP